MTFRLFTPATPRDLALFWLLAINLGCTRAEPPPASLEPQTSLDASDSHRRPQAPALGSGSASDGTGGASSIVASGAQSGPGTARDASAGPDSSETASSSSSVPESSSTPSQAPPAASCTASGAAPQCAAPECWMNSQCTASGKFVCNPNTGSCVQCVSDADCGDVSTPRCDRETKTCQGCVDPFPIVGVTDGYKLGFQNPACTRFDTTRVCGEKGTCLQCDADHTACPEGVCDIRPEEASFGTCNRSVARKSGKACEPCINSDQCDLGLGCVKEEYKVSSSEKVTVGWFCMFRVEPTLAGTSDKDIIAQRDGFGVISCTAHAKPYTRELLNVTALGYPMPRAYCGPSASTCPAIRQYKTTPCLAPSAASSLGVETCGANLKDRAGEAIEDAVCLATDSSGSEWRCAPRCLTDDDCVYVNGSSIQQYQCPAGYCSLN
jgi:hypothetical protein